MRDQDGAPLADSSQDYRLPKNVTPRRYDIRLTPDLTAFTFQGEVSVAIVVNEAPSMRSDDPNWIAYPAVMDPMRRQRLSEKAAELRKSHPLIDWSDGDGSPGLRRVAMWASEPAET